MSTFKVSITLILATLAVVASTPPEGATRVTLIDASGADVASQDSGYEFTGIYAGDYVMRAELLDVNGATIGTPYTQSFVVAADTRVVTVPAGATITVTAEA